jgi:hypothetical protein
MSILYISILLIALIIIIPVNSPANNSKSMPRFLMEGNRMKNGMTLMNQDSIPEA